LHNAAHCTKSRLAPDRPRHDRPPVAGHDGRDREELHEGTTTAAAVRYRHALTHRPKLRRLAKRTRTYD
jgi:hypothetical protein